MARDDPTIYMRIPQELKDLLDAASEENRRSMTAEVVARLHQSFSVSKAEVPEAVRSGGSSANAASQVGDETLETVKRIEEQLQVLAQAMLAQPREPQEGAATAVPEASVARRASKSARSNTPKN